MHRSDFSEPLNSENMFILLPHLIDSLGKYKILGGKHFSLRILKALLHCFLAYSAALSSLGLFSGRKLEGRKDGVMRT